MIRLIRVSNLGESSNDLKSIYIDSFPSEERREWQELEQLLEFSNFEVHQLFKQQQLIGLIHHWNLPGFVFIEHFAIRDSCQGKGYGAQVLRNFIGQMPGQIIVEVEEPTSEAARRRITFYERLGFFICSDNYWQPPYSADKKKIKMLLMSFPEKLQGSEFDEIKKHIYTQVYHQDKI